MCLNAVHGALRCPGVRHLHCFEPPKSRDQMEDELWYCMYCEAHGLKNGFLPPRKKCAYYRCAPGTSLLALILFIVQ